MPGNLLFANKQFPNVSGDKESDLKQILNYLYMLQEELRYTMSNMGIENFNTTELSALSAMILGDGSIAEIQATADSQGASISLLTAYTGLATVVDVDAVEDFTDTTLTYKIGTNYYRYNGTAWVVDTNIASAALTLAAINGQSSANLNADRINFTGFTTFVRPADLSSTGSTTIDGGRISTGTLYADSLASVTSIYGYDYIAMKNGIDFSNVNYMQYEDSNYDPYDRSVQGLHAIAFNGDNKLDTFGRGMADNGPTSVQGYVQNRQGTTGVPTQFGLDMGARNNIRLMGQAFGQTASGDGVYVYSMKPDTVVSGDIFFELRVIDSGIYAYKVQYSGGTYNTLGSSTILS